MTARRRIIDPLESKEFALATVIRLGELRRSIDAETPAVLRGAYATGLVSWTQLGAALGTTGSVAWHLAHPSGTAEEARIEEG